MEKQYLKFYIFSFQKNDYEKALKSVGVRFTFSEESCARGYIELKIFASAYEMFKVGKILSIIELKSLCNEK